MSASIGQLDPLDWLDSNGSDRDITGTCYYCAGGRWIGRSLQKFIQIISSIGLSCLANSKNVGFNIIEL